MRIRVSRKRLVAKKRCNLKRRPPPSASNLHVQAGDLEAPPSASNHADADLEALPSASNHADEAISLSSDNESVDEVTVVATTMPPPMKTPTNSVAAYGLSMRNYIHLCSLGAPVAFFNILHILVVRFGECKASERLTCLDGFAGVARIFQAFASHGYDAAKYDIKFDSIRHDILSPIGFLTILQWCRCLEPGASISHWGIVCSSWVFMSRSRTRRTLYNIDGTKADGSCIPSVKKGNTMASRLILLCMFLTVQRVIYILEQPASSLLYYYKRVLQLQAKVRLHNCSTWLGAFGADSMKHVHLLSNHSMVRKLHRHLFRKSFIRKNAHVVIPALNGGVTGGPQLKATQEYPVGYANALLEAFQEADFSELDAPYQCCGVLEPQEEDGWVDAELVNVCNYIGVPHDTLLLAL